MWWAHVVKVDVVAVGWTAIDVYPDRVQTTDCGGVSQMGRGWIMILKHERLFVPAY